MSNNETLSDIYETDKDSCLALCEAAGLYYSARAVEMDLPKSEFLTGIKVKDAQKDAKQNGRPWKRLAA